MAAPTFTLDTANSFFESIPRLRKTVVGQLVVDDPVGANAGDIPASLFGMTFIRAVQTLIKSDNSLVVKAAPDYAGASIIGSNADSNAAANIPSGT